MATLAFTTSTSLVRRWLPGLGRTSTRRPAATTPRRSVLGIFARGVAIAALPSAMTGSPLAATARPAFAPTLLASNPPIPVPGWMVAQQEAAILAAELRHGREALEARIGPRGLVLGTLQLPNGRTVPIRANSFDSAKKLWRRMNLGPDLEPERAGVMEAVRASVERWDAEAERIGLKDLERRATAARDRAQAGMRRAAGLATQQPVPEA